jgi:hypothetical protein
MKMQISAKDINRLFLVDFIFDLLGKQVIKINKVQINISEIILKIANSNCCLIKQYK